MSPPVLRLKKNEERRLRAGHLWVYSNEVDSRTTPLGAFRPGEQVCLETAAGKALGTAYVNPHSLICARLVSREGRPLDRSLLVHRLKVALSLRERLFDRPFYRLVHGEGDFLPGLIVDRYGDVLVVQVTTAGMEAVRDAIQEALEKVLAPAGILWRNDTGVRELEGLEREVAVAAGEVPGELELEEAGARFRIDPAGGQKTGWFFDQRANRDRLMPWVAGARVLDLFAYVGGWGVRAALAGAAEVTCVDGSAPALERVAENAALNGVEGRVAALQGDVFDVLADLRAARERFDVVICDPPAFIKRKRDAGAGAAAYRRLNQQAMQVLGRDGLLVSCSCSHHYPRERMQGAMLSAARHIDRNLQLLAAGAAGPDHPVNPAIPETDYLKVLFARLLPAE